MYKGHYKDGIKYDGESTNLLEGEYIDEKKNGRFKCVFYSKDGSTQTYLGHYLDDKK